MGGLGALAGGLFPQGLPSMSSSATSGNNQGASGGAFGGGDFNVGGSNQTMLIIGGIGLLLVAVVVLKA